MTDDRRRVIPSLLGMLKDVLISGAITDGFALVWDNTAKQWKPGRQSPIEAVNTVATSGATQTLPDVTTATMHDITLTANCTFTFPTAAAGKSFSVRLKQDGTGSRTATWPSSAKWPGSAAPTLSTAAGGVDTFWFVCFDGTRWEAGPGGKGHG